MATRTYGRPTLPWPLRLFSWLFSAALVLFVMLAAAGALFALGASAYYELTRTTPDDVNKMIARQLPTGSSVERINAVLDEEGIEHGVVQPFPGDDLELRYAGVTKGTPVINATVRSEGYSVELVDIQVAFILDENGLLKDHVVYEQRHSPDWPNVDIDDVKPQAPKHSNTAPFGR